MVQVQLTQNAQLHNGSYNPGIVKKYCKKEGEINNAKFYQFRSQSLRAEQH